MDQGNGGETAKLVRFSRRGLALNHAGLRSGRLIVRGRQAQGIQRPAVAASLPRG
jgi:hypothetical protein